MLALDCDVSDEKAVEAAFAETVAKLGRVDGCFANAGVSGRGTRLVPGDDERGVAPRARRSTSTAPSTRSAPPRGTWCERGGGGVLVGTASLAAIEAPPRSEHYAATKGGMISMIRALAVEFARHGMRANAILPGWIETDMTANAIGNEKFAKNVLPRIPMRRWGTGDDFGGIAVYLMSAASRLPHRRHVPHRRRLLAVLIALGKPHGRGPLNWVIATTAWRRRAP